MSLPLEYGRRYTFTENEGKVSVTEQVFVGHEEKKRLEANVETIRLRRSQDFLAECVKLDKRFQTGEIDLPGIQLFRDPRTGTIRVEVSYICEE